MIHPSARIDPTAYIDPQAEIGQDVVIGAGTKVWAHACIMRGSQVGSDCILGRYAHVEGSVVGNGCKIQNNAYIPPGIKLEDGVFIGPSAKFANERYPRAQRGPDEPPFVPDGAVVKRGAAIGMDARIGAGVTIGEGAMVGMGAIIVRDVPAGATVVDVGRIIRLGSHDVVRTGTVQS